MERVLVGGAHSDGRSARRRRHVQHGAGSQGARSRVLLGGTGMPRPHQHVLCRCAAAKLLQPKLPVLVDALHRGSSRKADGARPSRVEQRPLGQQRSLGSTQRPGASCSCPPYSPWLTHPCKHDSLDWGIINVSGQPVAQRSNLGRGGGREDSRRPSGAGSLTRQALLVLHRMQHQEGSSTPPWLLATEAGERPSVSGGLPPLNGALRKASPAGLASIAGARCSP